MVVTAVLQLFFHLAVFFKLLGMFWQRPLVEATTNAIVQEANPSKFKTENITKLPLPELHEGLDRGRWIEEIWSRLQLIRYVLLVSVFKKITLSI
jgi:hypothetical protein